MGADGAADAQARASRAPAGGRVPGGDQRGTLPGPFGLRLADAAGPLRALANRLRLVSGVGSPLPVPDHSRRGANAGPGAGRARGESLGGGDRQPVDQGSASKSKGLRAAKKVVGRKRHIAVDTDGRLLMVHLTPADVSDSTGAQAILDAIRKRWPWVKHLFADAAYDRLKLMDKAAYLDFVVEIIRRSDGQKGFEVLPRRWVVERTFGWMTRWRRLVRDYEQRIDVSYAMILVAMGGNLLRRNAHP